MTRRLIVAFLLGVLAFAPGTSWSEAASSRARADEVPMGRVRGPLRCSKPRPKQPVVIYLERVGGELERSETHTHRIGQKGARFEPPFLVIVAKDSIVFENDEDQAIDHNVYGLGAQSF